MRSLKHLFFTLLAVLLVLGLFSPGAYAKKNVITIGFTGPLSGPAAQYGRDVVAGIEMGIQDLNAAGGITIEGKKYTFELKTYDDGIDPTAAVNNCRRLRSRDGAYVIWNPVFNTLAPMMQINQQKGSEFLIMGYTSTPNVDDMKNDYTIAIPPPFSSYVNAFVDYAWNEEGYRKGAMVCTLGAYGDVWRKTFAAAWKAKGGEITADKPANYYADTDFSAQISAALATGPEFMLIGGPSVTTGLVIEQARNLGFKGGFILIDQAKMNYIAEVSFKNDLSKMNGVLGVARTLDLAPHHITKPFIDRYKRDYGGVATSENMLNYSATIMLGAAMEKAQTYKDPKAIRAAFDGILPMDLEKNPIYATGIQGSRLIMAGTIQMIKDNQYSVPMLSIWWLKNKADFEKTIAGYPERGSEEEYIFAPLEGYAR